MAKISIIIPVLNEALTIQAALYRLGDSADIEVIVVDAGSQDRTVQLALEKGACVIRSTPGRAQQMNRGAAVATGEVLLFLHADTQLPVNYQYWVKQTLSQPATIAGAFELKINGNQRLLRLVEKAVNWRSHFLAFPYGDQAIFLKTDTFQAMGGFAELPIMEDFQLVQRLRRQGKIAIVPAAVVTSGRRWQTLGVIKTTLINQLIIVGYYLGVPPTTLVRWYGRK